MVRNAHSRGSRRLRLAVAAAICAACHLAAGPNRFEAVPGTIPSETTRNLTVGPRGLVWIAADDGVYRFDGAHYHKIPGFPLVSARFIAADRSSQIWVAGKQGIAVYRDSKWRVILNEAIGAMTTSTAGVWIDGSGGLRLINAAGEQLRRIPDAHPTGALVADPSGAIWFPCGPNICTIRPPDFRLETQPNPVPGDWKKVVPAPNGKLWISTSRDLASIRNGRMADAPRVSVYTYAPGPAETLDPFLTPQGKVFTIRRNWQTTPDLSFTDGFPQSDSCSVFSDESTRWFCTTTGAGRSHIDPDWHVWTSPKFGLLRPDALVPDPSGGAPFLLTEHGVHEFHKDSDDWERSGKSPAVDTSRMTGDGFGGYWIASQELGLVRTGPDFAVTQTLANVCESVDTIRSLFRDGAGRTWIGGKDPGCFFEVTGRPGAWRFKPQTLPGSTVHTVAIHADPAGRPWVGYEEGLAYLDDGDVWRRIQTSEPFTQVREFTFDGDGVIWASKRRNGYFVRLERKGDIWNVQRFPAAQYPPADSYALRRDSRGWIWRGTNSGVAVARPGHYAPADWLVINRRNGLGSVGLNLDGWHEDKAGNIWIAGSEGVTKLKPSQAWFNAPANAAPFITRFAAGDQSWLDPDRMPVEVPAGAKTVEVDLSTLDAPPFRRAKLRYRLSPGEDSDWKESSDGTLRFNGLANGTYTLEAAYTGDGPAPVARWEIRIGGGPLSSRNLLASLSGAGLLMLGGLVWWRREWATYWIRKRAFLLTNALLPAEPDAPVAWNNHIGKTFAHRFEVLEVISRGGFAVTYRARDLTTGAAAAVKVLHRVPGRESWVRDRFAHEVAALVTLSHPGVVRLLDSWISKDGEPCLAMEFLPGPTLRQLLDREGPLGPARAAALIEQLGDAVGAVHARGVVHRDLKPDNIVVLDQGGRPVIIDFGTSAAKGPDEGMENTTTLAGSLAYLAPERLRNQYSPASDTFSLGVVILEILTGKRLSDSQFAVGDPEFLGELAGLLADAETAALLARAFEHQPSKRPASAAEWTRDLARLLRQPTDRPST